MYNRKSHHEIRKKSKRAPGWRARIREGCTDKMIFKERPDGSGARGHVEVLRGTFWAERTAEIKAWRPGRGQ